MTDNPIRFGTSGWRGIIAEDFTFGNVRLAAAAIAHYALGVKMHPRMLLGYDTRFMSERFAAEAGQILASHGIEVHNTSRPHPTPALAYEIIHEQLDGGINITASHNPAEYNGLKFSTSDGAPALPEVTKNVEKLAGQIMAGDYSLKGPKFTAPLFRPADPRPAYLKEIKRIIDLEAIAKAKLKIAYDPLYGCARGYLDEVLREAGIEVHTLHDYRDVLFSGVGPEPSAPNLSELAACVKEQGYSIGLSTDGDADRFGIVDSSGAWIHPNYVLGVLADYMHEVRTAPGGLARTVATTHLIDAVGKFHHAPVYQTPVGFKYIGEMIKEGKVALGGEESAGMSIHGHLPEKDGILACLLMAEAVAKRGLSVREQIAALFKKVGPYYSDRVNLHLKPDVQKRLLEKLKTGWEKFDSRKVTQVDRTDGLKMICEDGSWVLMRLSGTEPVLRVYCEAPSAGELEKLMLTAKELVLNG
ncbi:MAG: phosphoglucomutase/phosphomannomutase family protein [Terriglobia bacterium]